jgi:hypothetical protein
LTNRKGTAERFTIPSHGLASSRVSLLVAERRCGSSSEVEVPERLPGGVLHDEAGVVVIFDDPRRREAAG